MLSAAREFLVRASHAWLEAVKREREIELLDALAQEQLIAERDAHEEDKEEEDPIEPAAARRRRGIPSALSEASPRHIDAPPSSSRNDSRLTARNDHHGAEQDHSSLSPISLCYSSELDSSRARSRAGRRRVILTLGADTAAARRLGATHVPRPVTAVPGPADPRTICSGLKQYGAVPHRTLRLPDAPQKRYPALDLGPYRAALDLGPYRAALECSVRDAVREVVFERINQIQGTLRAVIRDALVHAARERCPPATGAARFIRSRRPVAIPSLRFDAEDEALLSRSQRASPTSVVASHLGYSITAEQLQSLLGTNWLNDQVINLYCRIVQEVFPNVVTLGSFLMAKLATNNPTRHEDAQRWTAACDVFSPSLVLVVVNCGQQHWTLAVVNNALQRLEYYDSLGGVGDRFLGLLVEFLDDEWRRKQAYCVAKQRLDREGAVFASTLSPKEKKRIEIKGASLPPSAPPSAWPRYTPGRAAPQQRNGYDCGVFVCQFCVHLAMGVPLHTIAQSDMPLYRRLMTLELLLGRLLARLA